MASKRNPCWLSPRCNLLTTSNVEVEMEELEVEVELRVAAATGDIVKTGLCLVSLALSYSLICQRRESGR